MARKAQVMLDPNKLSEDGTVTLRNFAVSKDGRYLGLRMLSYFIIWG